MMTKGRNHEKGMALASVLVFALILTGTGMGFLYMAGGERISAKKDVSSRQAFYLAEAGIERAIKELNANPDWSPYVGEGVEGVYGDEDFGQGAYSVDLMNYDSGNNSIEVEATGYIPDMTAPKAEKKIWAKLKATPGLPPAFDYALYSGNSISAHGIQDIYGNIYAVQNITFPGITHIHGSVITTGSVTLQDISDVHGDVKAIGDVRFEDIADVYGNVETKGNVWSQADITGSVKALQTVYFYNQTQTDGDVAAGGNIDVMCMADTGSNVSSTANITLDDFVEVMGDATANGTITKGFATKIYGTETSGASLGPIIVDGVAPVPPPEISEADCRAGADIIITPDAMNPEHPDYDSTLSGYGSYRGDGKFQFNCFQGLKEIIFVEDGVVINGINGGEGGILITDGDMEINGILDNVAGLISFGDAAINGIPEVGSADFKGLIYVAGALYVNGVADFDSTVIAGNIVLNAIYHPNSDGDDDPYDPNMIGFISSIIDPGTTGGPVMIDEWKEGPFEG